MNQIVLIGRLTRDPELRFVPGSGTSVGRFGIAVDREFKKEGQPNADFFNVKSFGKQAENAANYLKKGRKVAVIGRLQNNHYEDKNGVKRYSEEIIASRIEFLEWGDSKEQQQESNSGYGQQSHQQPKQGYGQQSSGLDEFQPYDGNLDDPPF